MFELKSSMHCNGQSLKSFYYACTKNIRKEMDWNLILVALKNSINLVELCRCPCMKQDNNFKCTSILTTTMKTSIWNNSHKEIAFTAIVAWFPLPLHGVKEGIVWTHLWSTMKHSRFDFSLHFKTKLKKTSIWRIKNHQNLIFNFIHI